jgi:hypothetical protein
MQLRNHSLKGTRFQPLKPSTCETGFTKLAFDERPQLVAATARAGLRSSRLQTSKSSDREFRRRPRPSTDKTTRTLSPVVVAAAAAAARRVPRRAQTAAGRVAMRVMRRERESRMVLKRCKRRHQWLLASPPCTPSSGGAVYTLNPVYP